MRVVVVTLFAAAAAAAQQHGDAGEKKIENPVGAKPEAIAAGKKLFRESCGACHGPDGGGGRGPNLSNGELVRALNDEKLFGVIKKGVPGTDMPPSTLGDDRIWEVAAFTRSLSAPAAETPQAGDAGAGEALFRVKGDCGRCHMIKGRGGFLGPDLSDAGMLHSVAQLREAITDPNAGSLIGYQWVTVKRKDGRKVEGVAKNFTNYSIQILDDKGKLHLFAKADLTEIAVRKTSIMPADFKTRFSARELDDLIAYLSTQTVRPKGDPSKGDEKK
jgi:cytochrome c oxidase cbb3-type subunit III